MFSRAFAYTVSYRVEQKRQLNTVKASSSFRMLSGNIFLRSKTSKNYSKKKRTLIMENDNNNNFVQLLFWNNSVNDGDGERDTGPM
jgi:hypothetical protein